MKSKLIYLSLVLGLSSLLSAFMPQTPQNQEWLTQSWQMTDFRFTPQSLEILKPMDANQRLVLKEKLDRLIAETRYRFERNGKVFFHKPAPDPSQGTDKEQEGEWELKAQQLLEVKAKNGKTYRYRIIDISATKLILRPEVEANLIGDMIFEAQ